MGRKMRTVVVCAACVSALTWVSAAVASCNPGRTPVNLSDAYKDGWTKDPLSGCYDGVIASITRYAPYFLEGTQDTQAFIRLTDAVHQFANLGWDFGSFSQLKIVDFAAEATPNSGGYTETFLYDDFGGDFKITFSSNAFHFFENGTSVYTYTNTGYTGCDAREYGELWNTADQMMGGYVDVVRFQHAQVRNNGNWSYYDGTSYNNGPNGWYGNINVSSTEEDIWDWACP